MRYLRWKNIFSTKKCLTVDLTTNPSLAAASAGGRLIKIDEDHILLSIGDFYADGVNGPAMSQDLRDKVYLVFDRTKVSLKIKSFLIKMQMIIKKNGL